MRVTFLLVAFLAGAHSFKAVERRAKPMGKGWGGVVTRSIVEAAIQTLALDDKIAARHAVNVVRRTFPGVPGCAMNPHVTGRSGDYSVPAGNPPALPFHRSRVMIVAHDTSPDILEGSHGHMPGPAHVWGTLVQRRPRRRALVSAYNTRFLHRLPVRVAVRRHRLRVPDGQPGLVDGGRRRSQPHVGGDPPDEWGGAGRALRVRAPLGQRAHLLGSTTAIPRQHA